MRSTTGRGERARKRMSATKRERLHPRCVLPRGHADTVVQWKGLLHVFARDMPLGGAVTACQLDRQRNREPSVEVAEAVAHRNRPSDQRVEGTFSLIALCNLCAWLRRHRRTSFSFFSSLPLSLSPLLTRHFFHRSRVVVTTVLFVCLYEIKFFLDVSAIRVLRIRD